MDQTRRTFLKFMATAIASPTLVNKVEGGQFFSVSPSVGATEQKYNSWEDEENLGGSFSVSVSSSVSSGPEDE